MHFKNVATESDINALENENKPKNNELKLLTFWSNFIFFKSHTAFVMVFLANRDEMNDLMRFWIYLKQEKMGGGKSWCYFGF